MSLRVGLIGAGAMGRLHAEAWADHGERSRVVAVADVDEAAAAGVASISGAAAWTDYRELLARTELDAVDICVPPNLHVEIVPACADAGVAILCEKPVATDLAEAHRIGAALDRSGVTYMAAHNTLFYPTVARARALLERGELGRTYLVRSWECYTDVPPERWALRSPVLSPDLLPDAWRAMPQLLKGGGALIDGGFHGVYRLLHLARSEPVAVTAFMGSFHPRLGWTAEDTAAILVSFDDGAIGQVVISYAFDAPGLGPDTLFSVVGREGVLGGSEHSLYLRPAGWAEPSSVRLGASEGDAAWRASIRAEIGHFAESLLERRRPLAGFEEGRRSLAVVRAAYESAGSGHTIRLDDAAATL